jgi:hypothetical protein
MNGIQCAVLFLNSFSLTAERDVYSHERTTKDLGPLGAKPGSGTIADAKKSDCAPTGASEQRKNRRCYEHLAPMGRSGNNVLLHF